MIITALKKLFSRRKGSSVITNLETRISRLERANLTMLKRLVQIDNSPEKLAEKKHSRLLLVKSPQLKYDFGKEPTYH